MQASVHSTPSRMSAPPAPAGRLHACWATSQAEVRAAQRLRQCVFFDEMGAHAVDPGGAATLDVARFDAFCDHLLVKTQGVENPGEEVVVGTCRVLSPEASRRAGGCYADTEFDMSALHGLRDGTLELGRSCVHRDWRRGGVIMMLWTALAAYMQERRLVTVIGCCSVSLADDGATARALWTVLGRSHLVAEASRVFPRIPFDTDPAEHPALAGSSLRMPALMKGYLRCGARLLGAPAHDPAFNTADFPMMLQLDDLTASYRQHFVGAAA